MIKHQNDSAQQINLQNLSGLQEKLDVKQRINQLKQQAIEIEICKICLCEIQNNKNQLISPCECAGSMKFVHQKCLREWLNCRVKKNYQKGNNTYQISCQICKFPYIYDIGHKYQCTKSNEIIKRVKQSSRHLVLGLLFCFICLAGISICGYYTFSDKKTTSKNQKLPGLVFIISVVFLGSLTLIWVLVLVRLYLINKIGIVKHIKNKNALNANIKLKKEIVPHIN